MPIASSHATRKIWSRLIANGDAGRWIELDKLLHLPPEGAKFIGRITTEGADLGKLGLIDGSNTGGKVMGFLSISINANFTQTDIHARAATPLYDYAVGEKVYMITDNTGHFLVKVNGDISAVKAGMSYGLKIVDGEQLLDVASAGNGPVVVTDEITESQRGFVRVKFNTAAVA